MGDWYYTWDCSSGCVWDPDAILDFKQGVKVQHAPGFVKTPPDEEDDDEADGRAAPQ